MIAPRLLFCAAVSTAVAAASSAGVLGLDPDLEGSTLYGSVAARSADRGYAYVVDDDELRAYRMDPVSFAVTLIDSESVVADGGALTVSGDGARVYATAPDSSLLVFARDGGTGQLDFVATVTPAGSGVAELDEPVAIATSPDGIDVYVACRGSDSVVRFAASETPALTPNGVVPGFPDPAAMLLAANGGTLYVATTFDDAIHVLTRSAATGDLTPLETHTNGAGDVTELIDPLSLAIPPDGRSLYVGTRRGEDGVAFARDVADGTLTFLGDGPAGAQIDAGDRHVWARERRVVDVHDDSFEHALVVHERDAVTAITTLLDGIVPYGTATPFPVLAAPDDAIAYAGAAFRIFESTGFLRSLEDHTGAAAGLSEQGVPWLDVDVTPDGRGALVLSGGGIAVFRRNLSTGRLTFVEREIEGIWDPRQLVISADSRFVYAADGQNGILRFARDTATGALAFAPLASAAAQFAVRTVTLAGDDLYAIAVGFDAIDRYARDGATGEVDYESSLAAADVVQFVESPGDGALFAFHHSLGGFTGWVRIPRGVDGELGEPEPRLDRLSGGLAPASDSVVWVASGSCPPEVGACSSGFVALHDGDETFGFAPLGVRSTIADAAAVSPDGRRLYLGIAGVGRIVALDVDVEARTAEYLDALDAEWIQDVAVSPDGSNVYAATAGEPNELLVYAAPEAGGWAAALAGALSISALLAIRTSSRPSTPP